VIRLPAVAGSFYPAGAEALRAQVDAFLAGARPGEGPPPKALVAPHAGYMYSGAIAGAAYATVGTGIRRVVLLGPAHYVPIRGLALPGAKAMRTPLGDVVVEEFPQEERALPVTGGVRRTEHTEVGSNAAAHAPEHSLEVHLPFLQRRLGDFSLVPLLVGLAAPSVVAKVLEAAWGGAETLVVVSTDLSHYLPYRAARDRDEATAKRIEALELVEDDDACGAAPLNGLLTIARTLHMQVRRLDLRSSGDTAGDRSRVVGYGAFALSDGPS
jgi:MEMO1 family protein